MTARTIARVTNERGTIEDGRVWGMGTSNLWVGHIVRPTSSIGPAIQLLR